MTKISPDLLAMVGRHSIQYPEDRLARVAFLPQKSGLLEDSTAASWGMTLDHRMMEVCVGMFRGVEHSKTYCMCVLT